MIVLQFDRRYFRWARLLLGSLALHEPGRRVLCDAVGLDRRQLRALEAAHPSVTYRNSHASGAAHRTDMANRKPFVLRNAIDLHPGEPWFCLLDADMLVRRGLSDLWSLADAAPAALVLTDGMWEGRFYARLVTVSSLVLVRPDGRELIDRWAHWHDHGGPIDGIRPREWFWDQSTLFLAWCECGPRIAPISIDQFADVRLDPRTAIWAANVPDTDDYFRRFRAELELQCGACPPGFSVP